MCRFFYLAHTVGPVFLYFCSPLHDRVHGGHPPTSISPSARQRCCSALRLLTANTEHPCLALAPAGALTLRQGLTRDHAYVAAVLACLAAQSALFVSLYRSDPGWVRPGHGWPGPASAGPCPFCGAQPPLRSRHDHNTGARHASMRALAPYAGHGGSVHIPRLGTPRVQSTWATQRTALCLLRRAPLAALPARPQ